MTSTTSPAAPVVPSISRLRPLGIDEVQITGGLWGTRQQVNGTATLEHVSSRLESEGWLPNFDLAVAGTLPEGRRGREFSDSEVYKYLEALAWEIARTRQPADEARFHAVVERIAAAQEPDGYLNTMFGRPGQQSRWSDLEWGHELYCFGHLFQAAVARVRTTADSADLLVMTARRAADLVCAVFGEGGPDAVCGHAEVEVGLAELGRALGEPRYAAQARLFVDRRGLGTLRDIEWGRAYYQDDVPVRDAEALRGHAVRANYLAAGAVDVAVEAGDDGLLDALRRQWDRTVTRRTYITGGQGSHHQDEAFGDDWELPSDRAYSETCAGIGSIMFAWRLLLADGDSRRADLIERTLYNVVAASPSTDGRAFFYANTLHQRTPGVTPDPAETSPRASSSLRAPWFEVSCCPPNVARTFASLGAYIATRDDDGLQIHQFAPARIRTRLDSGEEIVVTIETAYPDEGTIRVRVDADAVAPWTLSLRVPAWAEGATLRVRLANTSGDGDAVAVPVGVAAVTRRFAAGDVVELVLPIIARATHPDRRIDAVRGCVAVERGPEVFAVESIDLPDGMSIDDLSVDAASVRSAPDGVWASIRGHHPDAVVWPDVAEGKPGQTAEVRLLPYRDRANRGPSTMRVWLPTS